MWQIFIAKGLLQTRMKMNFIIEELIEDISDVFPSIVMSERFFRVSLNYANLEQKQIYKYLADKSSDKITLESLDNDYVGAPSAIVHFISPEGGLYLVPIFMRICLLQYDDADLIPCSLVLILSGRLERADEDLWVEGFLELLTEKQRGVIARFILMMKELYEEDFYDGTIESALANFQAKKYQKKPEQPSLDETVEEIKKMVARRLECGK